MERSRGLNILSSVYTILIFFVFACLEKPEILGLFKFFRLHPEVLIHESINYAQSRLII